MVGTSNRMLIDDWLLILRLDVLNVSKLKAGLIMIDVADFSPWDDIQNTVRMFREEASAHDVDLQVERDSSMDALQVDRVRGDSGRLVQVVINLVGNAIKFTERACTREIRVRIGASVVPEIDPDVVWPEMNLGDLLPMCRAPLGDARASELRLWVAVADTGRGMTDEEQDRLFQRFAQASPRTYGEFGGFGLGLVSCSATLCVCLLMLARTVRVPDAYRITRRENPYPERAGDGHRPQVLHHCQTIGDSSGIRLASGERRSCYFQERRRPSERHRRPPAPRARC
jgi:hypothetical protein